jgi:hypothetical protein
MRGLLTASFLLVSSFVHADPDPVTRASLGDGYDLVIAQGGMSIVKGKQRARLADAMSIDKATLDKKTKQVTVKVSDYTCAGTTTHSWSLGHLDARMENTSAYALHKNKDYKASAAGFTKAVAADPTWKIPAINLASAQQLLGDKDAAIKTLTPWLTNEPIATYVQITTDPELSPLLDRAEVKALRAAKAGDVKLTQSSVDGHVAYAPDRKLLAVARTERSWGACVFQTDLEVYDVTNGKLVATTPIVGWSETSPECDEKAGGVLPRARKTVAKRAATLQTMLRDLGFKKIKVEVGTEPTLGEAKGDAYQKTRSSLKKAKLGVVAQDGQLRVFQGNTELGSAKTELTLERVVYIPDLHAVVAWTVSPGAEGCMGTDPTAVTLVPLKKP